MLFDYTKGKVVPYNVFNSANFSRDVEEILAISGRSRAFISDALDHAAQYAFWSKCEYEFIASDWPPSGKNEKIDVYNQLKMNWERFMDYVWKIYRQVL